MGALTRKGPGMTSFWCGSLHKGAFLCGAWCGVEILAGENMNGVEVGA